ncbi:MAG: hypothetical protein M3433_01600 [Actinomycetota bacterium]|nr:hypothetical protein [Actinomycetota bacterium]MDQ3647280.1 hypothetical protein [Actinomycetota bacterium]
MNRRFLATAAVAGGIVLVLLAVLADTLGFGGQEGFGWKQAVLLAVGLVVALLGAAMLAGVVKPRGARGDGEAGAPGARSEGEKPLPPPD